jgi:hypothetical protein
LRPVFEDVTELNEEVMVTGSSSISFSWVIAGAENNKAEQKIIFLTRSMALGFNAANIQGKEVCGLWFIV